MLLNDAPANHLGLYMLIAAIRATSRNHICNNVPRFGMSSPTFVKSVVRTCLRIRKGDRVAIFAWRHMLDLAEAFELECRKVGAFTYTAIDTDEVFYDTLLNLPLDYVETPNPLGLALMDVVTAEIVLSGPENPERMKEVPAERWAASFRADKPFHDKFLEKKNRGAYVMLGHVTPHRAKTYGFNFDAWKENVNAAVDVGYEGMQKLGKKLRDALTKARGVHITTPEGTDLTFSLEDRPIHIYDGVVDDEDIEKGAVWTTLPEGAVSLAPTEASVNGTFVADVPEPQYGLLIHGVRWEFKDGQLVSFEGGKNIEAIKATWEKGTGDKDKMGWFVIGMNPRARTGFLNNAIALGTVTIGLGDNRDLEGKNESDWGFAVTAAKPTVELDGKPIIKRGKITL